ncbi:MAG: ABC transporter ATP-binding protein [Candidatus Loosdrechtia sp.]|uniref:ABC transporter ATP-binding protein n=1 Tax=Candidatus Loosdrechtia sp. TaxID=3101272 RepID=UPI003A74DE75|nr:MAG: ABC transporter ATP-binding protein [Candidatus Jettenia sp. AMX2]
MKIKLQNITKQYHHTTAVHGLNLEIHDGEFLVVLGPSGSGKSTTLNMLAGLEIPTSGKIFFNDIVVNTIPPGKRDIALVFQNYALYPHMKCYDNIAFPLKVRKDRDLHQKVIQSAKMLGLSALLNKYPKELSGGERQRVALARALVRNPQVFLMDEPLSNLDARLRLSARGELKKLQRERNITTVYVTHDQTEALTLGDRIVIMDKGSLQQAGTPVEIYQKPQNTFIAGFIGAPPMNLIQVKKESTYSFLTGDNSVELSVPVPNKSHLILGIRPEHLTVVPAEKDYIISCLVENIEYLGDESIAHIKISPTVMWYAKNITEGIKTGSKAGLLFSQQNIHWFDTITKVRMN